MSVLCLIGRHRWLRRHDRVVQANGGTHQVCRRCGRERVAYKDPPPSGTVHVGGGVMG